MAKSLSVIRPYAVFCSEKMGYVYRLYEVEVILPGWLQLKHMSRKGWMQQYVKSFCQTLYPPSISQRQF